MPGATVIEPQELAAKIDANNLLLVQVTSAEVFAQAHLPGAVLVTPGDLVSGVPPARGKLPELAQLNALFGRLGYSPGQDIVAYDDEGGGWAGRFLWTLDCIGHRDWSYLNGGMHAWQAAGFEFEAGLDAPLPETSADLTIDQSPIAQLDDVMAAIDDDQTVVWDVRSALEYTGAQTQSARAGHIPGAINLDWMELKDPANAMRITDGLEERLAGLGITGKGRIITHCQTHHRSGLSYMIGRILGHDIVAYDGSWSEWGNRDDTPIDV